MEEKKDEKKEEKNEGKEMKRKRGLKGGTLTSRDGQKKLFFFEM